ncbi:hypothetical protein E2562_011684 [Oryza meyeriana var. granulata]|uniref:Uncharacterized protein n=1 Tax=Oryza meyeriana var. granulata TaxID=110450 RepID=A0A6G1DHK1_9ORYZ|nr:hypothetical protein E2562_011684 [Oryza meyeriana var. granulata]
MMRSKQELTPKCVPVAVECRRRRGKATAGEIRTGGVGCVGDPAEEAKSAGGGCEIRDRVRRRSGRGQRREARRGEGACVAGKTARKEGIRGQQITSLQPP